MTDVAEVAQLGIATQRRYSAPLLTIAGHSVAEAQEDSAGEAPPDSGQNPSGTHLVSAAVATADAAVAIWADAVDDLERVRIATDNRIRALQQVKGLDDSPEVDRLRAMSGGVRTLESDATKGLQKAMAAHPLGPWVSRTIGVGEKQMGRLLASIGDPAAREMPSQLWAYCGLHVFRSDQAANGTHGAFVRAEPLVAQLYRETHPEPGGYAPRRKRGVQVNWNTEAKTRVFLVAESCIKHRRSPYRPIYDNGRAKYAESVHHHECAQCGLKGKPAPIGSPLKDSHKHARAMRLVMKAILKDLWIEAKEIRSGAA